jgi:hypothetical protein
VNSIFRVVKEFVGSDGDGWNRVITSFEVRDGSGWRRARPEEATEIDRRMRSRKTVSSLG